MILLKFYYNFEIYEMVFLVHLSLLFVTTFSLFMNWLICIDSLLAKHIFFFTLTPLHVQMLKTYKTWNYLPFVKTYLRDCLPWYLRISTSFIEILMHQAGLEKSMLVAENCSMKVIILPL